MHGLGATGVPVSLAAPLHPLTGCTYVLRPILVLGERCSVRLTDPTVGSPTRDTLDIWAEKLARKRYLAIGQLSHYHSNFTGLRTSRSAPKGGAEQPASNDSDCAIGKPVPQSQRRPNRTGTSGAPRALTSGFWADSLVGETTPYVITNGLRQNERKKEKPSSS